MMLERLLVTTFFILISGAAILILRYWHMRRVSQAARPALTRIERPTLLYFRSEHCAPCVTQAYYLQSVERRFDERLDIKKIDVDVEREMASRYGVFTLPTTLIVDESGDVKHINYGLTAATKLTRQLENIL